MLRKLILVVVVVASVTAVRPAGQQQPDFSGGWTASKESPSGIAAAPSAVFGARFWLRHSGKTLVVVRPVRDTAVVATHTLDGSEVRSRLPGAMCLGDPSVVTSVAWDGAAIVHRSISQIPPGGTPIPGALRHIFRLASPDTLVVETTMRAAGSTEPTAVATVYKKMSDPEPTQPIPAAKATPATLASVEWISGTWIGTSGTATLEERWSPATGGVMHATSRTIRSGGVTAFEYLCIAERAGGLVYTAMPNGRSPATDFTLTAVDDVSATFENPAHDFPKMIRYARQPDGALHATISDGGKRQTVLVFKRQ